MYASNIFAGSWSMTNWTGLFFVWCTTAGCGKNKKCTVNAVIIYYAVIGIKNVRIFDRNFDCSLMLENRSNSRHLPRSVCCTPSNLPHLFLAVRSGRSVRRRDCRFKMRNPADRDSVSFRSYTSFPFSLLLGRSSFLRSRQRGHRAFAWSFLFNFFFWEDVGR